MPPETVNKLPQLDNKSYHHSKCCVFFVHSCFSFVATANKLLAQTQSEQQNLYHTTTIIITIETTTLMSTTMAVTQIYFNIRFAYCENI